MHGNVFEKAIWMKRYASSIESHLNLKQIIRPNSNIYLAERRAQIFSINDWKSHLTSFVEQSFDVCLPCYFSLQWGVKCFVNLSDLRSFSHWLFHIWACGYLFRTFFSSSQFYRLIVTIDRNLNKIANGNEANQKMENVNDSINGKQYSELYINIIEHEISAVVCIEFSGPLSTE